VVPRYLILCVLLAVMGAGSGLAQDTSPSAELQIEPTYGDARRDSRLKRMSDFLAGNPAVEFETSFVGSGDLPGIGQTGTARFIIGNPDKFRVELSSNKGEFLFVSDGTTLTIYRPDAGKYARLEARRSIVGTMYLAIGLLGAQARLIDFLWTVQDGDRVGVEGQDTAAITGTSCDQMKVHRFEDDWDVWLERSDVPLPCKIVSRRTDAHDRLVQTNTFRWKRDAKIAPETFSFLPPEGTRQVGASELE
jgi:hypothetical protein